MMDKKVLKICSSFWSSSDGVVDLCDYLLNTTYEAFLSGTSHSLLEHILNHGICSVCKQQTLRCLAQEFGYARLKILVLCNMLYRLSRIRHQVNSSGRIPTLLRHNAIKHYTYAFSTLKLEKYNQILPLINWMEALCGYSDLDKALFGSWLERLHEICNDIIDQDMPTDYYIHRSCKLYEQIGCCSDSWTQVTVQVRPGKDKKEDNSLNMSSSTVSCSGNTHSDNMVISKCMCSKPVMLSSLYQILTDQFTMNPDELWSISEGLEYMEDMSTDTESEYLSAEEETVSVKNSPVKSESSVEVKTSSLRRKRKHDAGDSPDVQSAPRSVISRRSRKLVNTSEVLNTPVESSSANKWQLVEEVRLYQMVNRYNPKTREDFGELCKYFPGRSKESLRRKWRVLKTKKHYYYTKLMPKLQELENDEASR